MSLIEKNIMTDHKLNIIPIELLDIIISFLRSSETHSLIFTSKEIAFKLIESEDCQTKLTISSSSHIDFLQERYFKGDINNIFKDHCFLKDFVPHIEHFFGKDFRKKEILSHVVNSIIPKTVSDRSRLLTYREGILLVISSVKYIDLLQSKLKNYSQYEAYQHIFYVFELIKKNVFSNQNCLDVDNLYGPKIGI
jgi:hypothetical protein